MALDTVSIQCFLAIAETLSFTKAADRVGRTQSAISQQIGKLENLVGKPLLNRGRNLELTNDGEVFLSYAKKIYDLQRESLDIFKEPELQGEIKFGLPEDFATMMLSDVLVEFTRMHPRVILNVECDLTLNLVNAYKDGKLDIILIKTNKAEEVPRGIEVWSESVDWIGKKELLPEITCLSKIPLVLSPSPCVYRGNVLESLAAKKLQWHIVYSSQSYAGKMAAVKAGLGITAIQKSMVPDYLDRLDLDFMPKLNDVHVSLIKSKSNKIIDSLEYFIMKKLKV